MRGYVEKVDHKYLDILFSKNRYMWGTYPKETRNILEVFRIYKWTGEYFDISSKPIMRLSFSHNINDIQYGEYLVNDKCINCKKCISVCPQKCIKFNNKKANIVKENCLRCGACKEICLYNAIVQV